MRMMYNPHQFDEACRYIERYNPADLEYHEVWNQIWDCIKNYADSDKSFVATAGFFIHFSQEEDNLVEVEVYVNPSLGDDPRVVIDMIETY